MFDKQRKKRLWSLILAVLMLALAILACGDEETPTKGGETPTEAPTQEVSQETPELAATEAPKEEPTLEATIARKLTATPAPTVDVSGCTLGATFQADVTISDNTEIEAVFKWRHRESLCQSS
jgi:hypothetical protein